MPLPKFPPLTKEKKETYYLWAIAIIVAAVVLFAALNS